MHCGFGKEYISSVIKALGICLSYLKFTSFFVEEKPKEQLQCSLQKTSSTGTNCSEESLQNTGLEEGHSITSDMPSVSAFFSLAALAEVAAMENVHRSVHASFPFFG